MSDESTTEEPEAHDNGRFDADYVAKLRAENAERRTKAKDADSAREVAEASLRTARDRLLALEVASATGGVLADPSDLLAHVEVGDLTDEDGNADRERILEAADALLARKPHLAPRTPTGDVGQGPRGRPAEVFDLAALLRERAG